jgi:precorrin-2 dehydrogenase/sirohydrochlorin ferrochelatase
VPGYYALMADLTGRRCVVVGGGAVAERESLALLEAGAQVWVVSPAVNEALAHLARDGRIRVEERPYLRKDLRGTFLIIAAEADPAVNARVAREARDAGILACIASSPRDGSCLVPAVIRRGELLVAIATAGRSPALARRIREDLERTFAAEYRRFLEVIVQVRERARREVADPRARQVLVESAIASDLLDLVRRGDEAGIRHRVDAFFRQPAAAAGR